MTTTPPFNRLASTMAATGSMVALFFFVAAAVTTATEHHSMAVRSLFFPLVLQPTPLNSGSVAAISSCYINFLPPP
ncbi:hypothetical protein BCR42DRAFT_409743 [Absidia repens]|uniref:Uncharacterized protein n=1 Tax=Absidia repens TaxID=90262 RepID=A0A1X2IPH2_9FUNG|nr:hypothetical protein BCR42DRAFT_409743 [Absidia repens]